jgi:hypothetical protein
MAVTMKNAISWDVMPCDSVRHDVSKEYSTSIIKMTRIGELGTLAVTSNQPAATKHPHIVLLRSIVGC